MYINRVLSYLDGWERLRLKHSSALEDIVESLMLMTPQSLRKSEVVRPYSSSRRSDVPITPLSFHGALDYFLREHGWRDYRVKRGADGIRLFVRNSKDGVAARMMFSDRAAMFPSWLLMETPKLHEHGGVQISVLLVPNGDFDGFFEEGRYVGPIFSFDRCRAQIADLLPLTHLAPFAIIGFGLDRADAEIENIEPSNEIKFRVERVIEKVIEFRPEHYQAGISILSYFGDVLKNKHPDCKAKVRIEQDGHLVRLHIETPDGHKETIEKTLEKYVQVVSEEAPPEELFDSPLQILALNNKLEMAKMEVRQTKELLSVVEKGYLGRITSLEEEVTFLRRHIGNQLQVVESTHRLVADQSECSSRVILAQVERHDRIVRDLLENAWHSKAVHDALVLIERKLESGVSESDEKEVKEALAKVRDGSPEIFSDLENAVRNTMYGVSGNIVYQWLLSVASVLV